MARADVKRQIVPGVSRASRSRAFKNRGTYKVKRVAGPRREEKVAAKTSKPAAQKAKKTDLESAILHNGSKFYPADSEPKPKQTRKTVRPTKLRKSITPGTVLVLLAGRFRGKKVVFLKQLASGLLLVTGPYAVNGIPVRRVNQAYVIATSTKVDVSSVKVSEKFNDQYFARETEEKSKDAEQKFFGEGAEAKKTLPAHKAADQKELDAQLVKAISAVPMLKSYLKASFSLTKGQAPHLMKF
ncbi:60S ribosomal protein L6-3 [Zancudomyces culisetae]|uniref:60S ribosomal protein L6-3 n=1 Tax=Zancudomyces culisetae TaxID=1213189 RepID=A0A1R1PCS1_ZANCU|nr:60S ribosomal protein L6-3 [Zancudomyces culisetae]|eukprot:OMH78741.1 60S ribosomal protein L6-3 [Zancudomyces culisetae]